MASYTLLVEILISKETYAKCCLHLHSYWIMLLQPPESFLGAMEEYIKNVPRHNMVKVLQK